LPTGDLGEHPNGNYDQQAASLSRGLAEIGILLAKITSITLVVLLIQGIITWLKKQLANLFSQGA